MESVGVALVGIDGWEEFTRPAVESIEANGVTPLVIDAASETPYPDLENVIRLGSSPSYAYAINIALEAMDADWSIVLNNDIICEGPFVDDVLALDPGVLWGMQLIEQDHWRWLGGWCYAIHRGVREAVGNFDESFALCGFEDADYCFRAKEHGIDVSLARLPFRHLWGKTRWGLPNYHAVREGNLIRLEAKYHEVFRKEWHVRE